MIIYVILAVAAVGLVSLLYVAVAPGPRRARAYRRAQRALSAGAWQDALAIVTALVPDRQSSTWRARLRHLAGECHQHGLDLMLKERQFDSALGHAQQAAALLDLDPAELRGRVVEAMLAEVRRLFAAGPAQA